VPPVIGRPRQRAPARRRPPLRLL